MGCRAIPAPAPGAPHLPPCVSAGQFQTVFLSHLTAVQCFPFLKYISTEMPPAWWAQLYPTVELLQGCVWPTVFITELSLVSSHRGLSAVSHCPHLAKDTQYSCLGSWLYVFTHLVPLNIENSTTAWSLQPRLCTILTWPLVPSWLSILVSNRSSNTSPLVRLSIMLRKLSTTSPSSFLDCLQFAALLFQLSWLLNSPIRMKACEHDASYSWRVFPLFLFSISRRDSSFEEHH